MNISFILIFLCVAVLALSGIKRKKSVPVDGADCLSLANTKAIKGIMALLLLLHHLSQQSFVA